jgi:drug/metabolite transporter (DMT)-like permease
VLVLLAASVGWGLVWLPLKHLGGLGVHGIALVAVAYGAGALVMLPVLVAQRSAWQRRLPLLLAIATLGGYANLAFTAAMLYGDVVRVMVLFYLLPVWGVLGGRLFLGEAIDGPRRVALVLAVAGAFLILGGPAALAGSVSWIDALALSCGIAFAANNLLFRAQQALPVGSKVAAMFLGCAALALLLLGAGVQAWPQAAGTVWIGVVALGVGWFLVATLGTQWGVNHLEAGRASILIIMELVTAVLSATLIGGERMSPAEMAGGALILLAALIEGRRPAS